MISGLHLLDTKVHTDSRGIFRRLVDASEQQPGEFSEVQVNLSQNPMELTLRGLHFQTEGQPEHKIVNLISGEAFIVVIDLRKESKTYMNSFTEILTLGNPRSIFIPSGCATGWMTLEPQTSFVYFMYSRFEKNQYSGIRFDDSRFGIKWPANPKVISQQDLDWPKFED